MRTIRSLCGPVFIGAGMLHFAVPQVYERIMPRWLPAHRELILLSGVAEAAGGAGLLFGSTRRWGGQLLILTLIAVFPANVEMALHPERFSKIPGGRRTLLARLPLQLGFIAWVLAAMSEGPDHA